MPRTHLLFFVRFGVFFFFAFNSKEEWTLKMPGGIRGTELSEGGREMRRSAGGRDVTFPEGEEMES